jgi:hypothetical protein
VDASLKVVRDKAQKVVDDYNSACEEWAQEQEQFLADLQDYLDGKTDVEPESPGPPPALPEPEDFPTPEDYSKAYGDGFLKYICDNAEVRFSWSGSGTDVSSGSAVSDPSFPTGFSVSGASGGGTLAWPSDAGTIWGKLSALASNLVVQLPADATAAFLPPTVVFKGEAQLEADPTSHVNSDPSKTSYLDVLEGVCTELIDSFKSNFKSETDCVHMVVALPNVSAGFSGKVKMSSIS